MTYKEAFCWITFLLEIFWEQNVANVFTESFNSIVAHVVGNALLKAMCSVLCVRYSPGPVNRWNGTLN